MMDHCCKNAIPDTRGAVKSVVTAGRVYTHNANGREELDDLSRDPLERNDLAGVNEYSPTTRATAPLLPRSCQAESNNISPRALTVASSSASCLARLVRMRLLPHRFGAAPARAVHYGL